MPDNVVAISLLVAKSIEVGTSKATNVMFCLKQISCSFKNSRVFRLHPSILVKYKILGESKLKNKYYFSDFFSLIELTLYCNKFLLRYILYFND